MDYSTNLPADGDRPTERLHEYLVAARAGGEDSDCYLGMAGAVIVPVVLVRLHRVFGCSFTDAQDIGQEAWIRLQKYLSGYKGRSNLDAWGWVNRIARNCLTDARKAQDKRPISVDVSQFTDGKHLNGDVPPMDDGSTDEDTLETRVLARKLQVIRLFLEELTDIDDQVFWPCFEHYGCVNGKWQFKTPSPVVAELVYATGRDAHWLRVQRAKILKGLRKRLSQDVQLGQMERQIGQEVCVDGDTGNAE